MLKLFKAKSLKNNTKTGQGAGVGAGVRGADSKNTKKQKGRSMVEMLGVLAIIGVLSIGGIQGYTMAMRRYRANEVLNIVQKYAMVVYSGCQQAIAHYGIVDEIAGYKPLYTNADDPNSWHCPGIKFTDAGLGNLPTGVLKIGGNVTDSQGRLVYVQAGWGDGGVSIKSLSSGDAVVITVQFETKELCETVMSITGKPIAKDSPTQGMIDEYGDDYVCSGQAYNEHAGYYLAVTTMMN